MHDASTAALILRLGGAVEGAVRAHANLDAPYALLDFPNYSNVGDSAIWLGELAVLQKVYGRRPSYVCASDNFNSGSLDISFANSPPGTIFLSGGGNFGDLYGRHQELRLTVMQKYGSRVVQLPQSIHFSESESMLRAREIIRDAQPALMVRDQRSYEIAMNFDCPVTMVPDAAFCQGPLVRPRAAHQELFVLKRQDKESVSTAKGIDWLDEPDATMRIAKIKTVASLRFDNPRFYLYKNLAESRQRRGTLLLSRGKRVGTDRLHGHILSTLLGIPNAVADNSTGKVHAFIDQWTGESPLVRKVASLSEA